jgi:acyl-coenzyme A thioesterase 9
VAVPPLQPGSAREQELYAQGQLHHLQRLTKRQQSLTLKPPTAAEVLLLHGIIQQAAAAQEGSAAASDTPSSSGSGSSPGASPAAPAPSAPAGRGAPMAGTQLSQYAIMHQQDRNQNNNIFGGHLMRMAFEAAFITASRHAGSYCEVLSMADVSFLHPVPIGCIVQLHSQVVYVEGHTVRVHVTARKQGQDFSAPQVTNDFAFAFWCERPAQPVVPETLLQAMAYLAGYRQHKLELQQVPAGAQGGQQQGPRQAG